MAPRDRGAGSDRVTEGDVNFGLFTCLWDHLLGTFRRADPSRRFVPGDFGVADRPDYPRAYAAQMVEPFRIR